jgi:hypothetical protein
MSGVVHVLRPRAPEEPHRRIRRVETVTARHQRRLRHLDRMRQWYARQLGGGKRAEHVTE